MEGARNVVSECDLEEKTAAADADLEEGHRVSLSLEAGRPPLGVEADDEVVETAAMYAQNLGEPVVYLGAGAC